MTPAVYNLTVLIDTDFSQAVTFYSDCQRTQTLNVSGYTFKAQVRTSFTTAVIFEFDISTTNAATGQIVVSISAADTLALTAGAYVWDLRVTDGDGQVERWMEGNVTVTGTVTRA
jgi:hypothetical protein